MLKKFSLMMLIGFICINLTGCFAVMAAMAESAKEKKTFNISYSDAIDVVKGSLKTMNIEFQSARIGPEVAEVRGKYNDDKIARIYLSKVSDDETLISVRVGTSEAGKADAAKIMQEISDYADLTLQK